MLDLATEACFAPIEEVVSPTWVAGHVVLIGDAAHATSTNMAQGAAMVVKDALVLAAMPAPGRRAHPQIQLRPFAGCAVSGEGGVIRHNEGPWD